MAIDFVCGAECQIHSTGNGALTESHWSSSSGASVVTSPVRSGSHAYQVVNGQLAHSFDVTGAAATYARFYFRFPLVPLADFVVARLTGLTNAARVYFDQSVGDIGIVADGGTTLDSSTNNFTPSAGTWYGVEMEVQPNTGGVKWRTWTESGGWTTSETVSANIGTLSGAFAAGASSTGTVYFDDIAVGVETTLGDLYDDTGTNGVDGYVTRLDPTSDGTHTFELGEAKYDSSGGTNIDPSTTTLYQSVDAADMEDETNAIYWTLMDTGDYAEFYFEDHTEYSDPRAAGLVHAVQQGDRLVIDLSDDDGSNWYSQQTVWGTQSAGVQYLYDGLATAPSGGAWTAALVDGMGVRIGVESTGPSFSRAIALEVEWTSDQPFYHVAPTDDMATTGWSSTPLWSKVDDDPDSPDGTVVTGAAS